MSGRIKFLDPDGNLVNSDNTPEMPYDYDSVSSYDASCGTVGLNDFQLPNYQCPSEFVCNAEGGNASSFADCIDSMNCQMLDGMTSNYGGEAGLTGGATDDIVLFCRQMIPHHQNAVNMANALLKTGEATCDSLGTEEGEAVPVGCVLEPIARSIINSQNHQIQTMQGILETAGVALESDCDFSAGPTQPANGGGPTPPTPGKTSSTAKTTFSVLVLALATVGMLDL